MPKIFWDENEDNVIVCVGSKRYCGSTHGWKGGRATIQTRDN